MHVGSIERISRYACRASGIMIRYQAVVYVPRDPDGEREGHMRESIWSEAMGENYIDIAFRQARVLAPDATLVLNEFDIGLDGPKFDALLALIDRLLERGLDVHVTELDVALNAETEEVTQASVYQRVVETCLDQPRCTILQTWGFTDRYSFRSPFDPLSLDRVYQPKPAYNALQEALAN